MAADSTDKTNGGIPSSTPEAITIDLSGFIAFRGKAAESVNRTSHQDEADRSLSPLFQEHAANPLYLGRLDHADGKAKGVGTCGDSIEIYVCLEKSEAAGDVGDTAGLKIGSIGHMPIGCGYTVACASAVCKMAVGKTMDQALLITPEGLDKELGGLPEDHMHCARLAVNTLGEALSDAYGKKRKNHADF